MIADDIGLMLMGVIRGADEPYGTDVFGQVEMHDMLIAREAFMHLNEKDRDVLTLRYRDGYTLEEIGKKRDVTKERVRQISMRAERRLRGWINLSVAESTYQRDMQR